MELEEVKYKLEFDKVTSKIKNYTFSELGKEKCDNIQFFTDISELNEELDRVIEIKKLIESGEDVDLSGLRDIRSLLGKTKIYRNFIFAEQFTWILNFLKISKSVYKYFNPKSKNDNRECLLIGKLTENLYYDKFIEHNIETTVDSSGYVKDTASANLKRIRSEIKSKSDNLRKLLTKILKNVSELELSQEDIISLRDGRFVIPVKVENKRKVPGIIHSSSGSGLTVFIEPEQTINVNNEVTELYYEEKREVERILIELTSHIAEHYDELINNGKIRR